MSENDKLAKEKFEKKLAELENRDEVPQGYEQYLKLIAYIPYPDKKTSYRQSEKEKKDTNS